MLVKQGGGNLSQLDIIKNIILNLLIKIFRGSNVSRGYLKKYLYIKDSIDISKLTQVKSDCVWTMWLQDEIPEICKFCIDSIKKYYPNVVVITEKNIFEYVDIPDYIWSKYKNGIISPAHFSDFVRVSLLDQYGGTWIDATCFMTQEIPKYILNSEVFFLRTLNNQRVSNFFIHSFQNNYIIHILRLFLTEYWKRENFAVRYFFFHDFLLLLVKHDTTVAKLWDDMPLGLNHNAKIMFKVLFKEYNPDLFDWLCKTSFIHKLTYKNVNETDISANSLYRHLI